MSFNFKDLSYATKGLVDYFTSRGYKKIDTFLSYYNQLDFKGLKEFISGTEFNTDSFKEFFSESEINFKGLLDYLYNNHLRNLRADQFNNLTRNWILFYVSEGETEQQYERFILKPFIRNYAEFVKDNIDKFNDEEFYNKYLKGNYTLFLRLFNIMVKVYDSPNINYVDVSSSNSIVKTKKNESKRIVISAKIDSPLPTYPNLYDLSALANLMNYPIRLNFYCPDLKEIYGFTNAVVQNYSIKQDRSYNNIKNISITMTDPRT